MADEFVGLAQQLLDNQPFSALLGTRVVAFVPGTVTMALALRREHTQQEGMVHNGVIAALAETALIFAGGSALGVPVDTATLTIHYGQPAAGTELRARGQALATEGERAVCHAEVRVVAAGGEVLVAAAQGTIVPRARVSDAPGT
jgi:uncharacterized protein (TIGR00369 family)